jgi:membrane associated rhomboid family serine protease
MLGRPWLTAAACALLVMCLMAQLNLPVLLSHMQRDGSAIRAGQFYRLFTALWFQDGGIVGGLFNIVMLAVLGVIAEQVLSRAAWLCIYLIGGLLSEVIAMAWQPVGAGNSVAYMSLAGALLGLAFYRHTSRARAIIAGVGLIAGFLLCLRADIHGAAAMIGCALLPPALRISSRGQLQQL